MKNRRRMTKAMERAGIDHASRLASCRTVEEVQAAIRQMGNTELVIEHRHATREWAQSLSDEQLLAELEKARAEGV